MIATKANVTVTTAGTAVPLASSRTAAAWVNIQALSTNTGGIYVGDSSVSKLGGGQEGGRLTVSSSIGQSFFLPQIAGASVYDLAKIFINADVNGEGVSITYMKR